MGRGMRIPYSGITREAFKELCLKRGKGSIPEDDKLARLYIEVASIAPKLKPVQHAKAYLLRRDGYTIIEAASILECSETTVERSLRQFYKYCWKFVLSNSAKISH